MTDRVRLAVAGAGVIGRRHAEAIAAVADAELACVVEPNAAAAIGLTVPVFETIEDMIAAGGVDGVILATPNAQHEAGALACIQAALPVLVEKPIATDLHAAGAITKASEATGIPVAVGHHRRHNPLIIQAKSLIDKGELGEIASVQVSTWFKKPDDYFKVEWRRQKGAGPVYLNLIHDIDLLLHLVGPVHSVQAMESNAIRRNEVEDTAVVLLRFTSGALGTVNICDSIVAPWSWELTARENPTYPATPEDCYRIGGTRASLSLPNLAVWKNGSQPSWSEPISKTQFPFDLTDPLVLQIRQFASVVRREELPLVSASDGLAALAVIEAIKKAAETGIPVAVEELA
ncbi:oxidoreductase [Sulfitobacter porphyrae]|nr:oxidoreductase [Sulfitobacter porphyrae]